jgi:hypothetical protein
MHAGCLFQGVKLSVYGQELCLILSCDLHSFAFIDAYSNNFFVAGTRATGGNASNFALVGPSFSGKRCFSPFRLLKDAGRLSPLSVFYINGSTSL